MVPAYNAERFLTAALASVASQLPDGSEIVVVDDGSSDGTSRIAEDFGPPVVVIRAPHQGIAASVNRGVAAARHPLLGFIDADDLWLPGKLERQLAALEADPALDGVLGHLRERREPDPAAGPPLPGLHRGVLLIRRAAWERVGDMEADLQAGEFVSWYLRAVDGGLRLRMLPDVVYERRIHGANTVLSAQTDLRAGYLEVVRRTLERRRREGGAA